jgi:hypothetical protein
MVSHRIMDDAPDHPAIAQNGKWGYINTKGEEVTKPRFDRRLLDRIRDEEHKERSDMGRRRPKEHIDIESALNAIMNRAEDYCMRQLGIRITPGRALVRLKNGKGIPPPMRRTHQPA